MKTPVKKMRGVLDQHDRTALGICLAVFFVWFGLLSLKYYYLEYYDWDLALTSHTLWNLGRGSVYSSLLGMSFLANHAEYIAFFLAPVYFLFNHPLMLIILKILSHAIGAYVLYLIGKKSLSPIYAIVLMCLFILYPSNIYSLLFEFHFEDLDIAPIFLLYYFFQNGKLRPFYITMVFITLLKENMPLIVMTFGIWGLVSKPKDRIRWGLVPFIYGMIVFYVSIFWVIPMFRTHIDSVNQYLGMYSGLGRSPAGIVKAFVFNPGKIIAIIFSPVNLTYLNELLRPLLYIPLFSPHILFLASPIFLQNLLSSSPQMHDISFHYSATIVPFLFIAEAECLAVILVKSKRTLFLLVFNAIVFACIVSTRFYSYDFFNIVSLFKDDLDPYRREMMGNIPADARVIATNNFLAELSRRRTLYAFINVSRDTSGLIFKPFQLPADVSHVLVDFNVPWLVHDVELNPRVVPHRIENFLAKDDWGVKDAVKDLVLFERNEPRKIRVIQRSRSPITYGSRETTVIIDDRFRLLTYSLGAEHFGRRDILPLVFYWKADAVIDTIYAMTIILQRGSQTVFTDTRRIGYTIAPTTAWYKDDYLKEQCWILVPGLTPGRYLLSVSFTNTETRESAGVRYAGADPEQEHEKLSLGYLVVPQAW